MITTQAYKEIAYWSPGVWEHKGAMVYYTFGVEGRNALLDIANKELQELHGEHLVCNARLRFGLNKDNWQELEITGDLYVLPTSLALHTKKKE